MPTSKPESAYTLAFLPTAKAEWDALDGSVKKQFKAALARRLVEPHVPASRLHGRLSHCYKIKLRSAGYRLIYKVDDKSVVVIVIAVGKRDNDAVYRAAGQRER